MLRIHPIVQERLAEIETLCGRFHVKTLELFGSATGDRFDPATSDVDFLVEFQPVERQGFADVYFKLLFGLEDLFGRKIDLVETKAITNPYFLEAIRTCRVTLYADRSQEALV